MKSQRPKLLLRPIFPRGRYAPKQRMNFVTNLHLYHSPSTTPWGDNINKHNMVIFNKTWKKCNEIQLTKIKMDLIKSKTKNMKTIKKHRARGRVG